MAQVRGTFPELYDNVDKILSAIMKEQLSELPKIYSNYFNIETSDRKFERHVTYVPMGDTQSKGEGDPYVMDSIRSGYTKDFVHTENGLGFEVSQTALEDDPENILKRAGQWLTFSARYLEEGRAANVFNNGFTTEQTPDGVSLFNATHALKGGGAGRNTLASAADLSATSLQQAMTDIQTQTFDEAGHLAMPVMNWYLVVPPALETIAYRLVASVQLPGSADNDINPMKALRTWRIIINPRLTDADAWMLVAQKKSAHGLTFYRRVPIELDPIEKDIRTNNRIIKVRHRFSVGAWTWVGVFGSPGL